MENILKTADEIRKGVENLATAISADYKDASELHLISFLNGGSVFCSDLMRKIKIPTELHHFGFNSISSSNEIGSVEITLDVKESLFQKEVILIEGLVISGRTPKYLLEYFSKRNPRSIEICAVGVKPSLLDANLDVKYSMFEFGKEWVTGFGIGKGIERSKPFLYDARPS